MADEPQRFFFLDKATGSLNEQTEKDVSDLFDMRDCHDIDLTDTIFATVKNKTTGLYDIVFVSLGDRRAVNSEDDSPWVYATSDLLANHLDGTQEIVGTVHWTDH